MYYIVDTDKRGEYILNLFEDTFIEERESLHTDLTIQQDAVQRPVHSAGSVRNGSVGIGAEWWALLKNGMCPYFDSMRL